MTARTAAAALLAISLAACRRAEPPPAAPYADLPLGVRRPSVLTIPFTLRVEGLVSALARSPLLAPQRSSRWIPLGCRGGTRLGISDLGCEVYVTLGQIAGGLSEYHYGVTPDLRSLRVVAEGARSNDVRFVADVDAGYSLMMRGPLADASCGEAMHWREVLTLTVAADYSLRTAFSHTLTPDKPCRIRILPFTERDVTKALVHAESAAIERGERALEEKMSGLSARFQHAAQTAWEESWTPHRLQGSQLAAYFDLQPKAVALLPIRTSGAGNLLVLTGALQVVVSPTIALDSHERPAATLPQLRETFAAGEPEPIVANLTIPYGAPPRCCADASSESGSAMAVCSP